MTEFMVWLAWFGAGAWTGAAGLAITLFFEGESWAVALHLDGVMPLVAYQVRRQLRRIETIGAVLALIGLATITASRGTILPFQVALTLLVAAIAVVLAFHVERRSGEDLPLKHMANIVAFGSLGVGLASMVAFSWGIANILFLVPVLLFPVLLTCGVQLGMAFTSALLFFPLRRVKPAYRERMMVMLGFRWAAHAVAVTTITLLGALVFFNEIWHISPRIVIIIASALLVLIFAQVVTWRRLLPQRYSEALALLSPAYPAEQLEMGVVGWRARVQGLYIILGTFVIVTLFTSVTLANLATSDLSADLTQIYLAPPRVPVLSPDIHSTDGTQTHTTNGVRVTLTVASLKVGNNTVHLTVTDAKDQIISGVQVTLLVNRPLVATQTGTVIAALSPNQGDYIARLNLPARGTWNVIVYVSTKDLSIASSAAFLIAVA